MAAPTISTVSPATGPAYGGNIVVIAGTNFNVAYDTSRPFSGVVPVAVLFGSAVARKVMVVSSTQVWAMAPACSSDSWEAAHAAVDLTVRNLDADGDPVAGEEVIQAAAYTYLRESLAPSATRATKAGPTAQVLEAFIGRLQRELLASAAMQTHLDYGAEGEAVVVDSEAPGIGIHADLVDDPDWSQWNNVRDRQERAGGDGYDVYRSGRAKMLVVNLTLSAKYESVYCRLRDAVYDTFSTYPYLDVAGDPDWDSTHVNKYPIDPVDEFRQASNPSNQELWVAKTTIYVHGIRLVPQQPMDRAVVPASISLTVTGTV